MTRTMKETMARTMKETMARTMKETMAGKMKEGKNDEGNDERTMKEMTKEQ